MQLLGASDQRTERKLVVRPLGLDLPDLISVVTNSLKHAAHAAHETDLLFDDLAFMAFRLGSLSLLILLSLLLLKDSLHLLAIDTILVI